jgi:hypothetical protein
MLASFAPSILPRFVPLLAASLALGGCLRPEQPLTMAFVEADHAIYMKPGTSTIKGEGFLRKSVGTLGSLARCSGQKVILVPSTPYFDAWVDIYKKGGAVAEADDLAGKHKSALRITQCDMQGKFEFEDLPAAKWHVMMEVYYEKERFWFVGGPMVNTVQTWPNKTSRVILANPNRV